MPIKSAKVMDAQMNNQPGMNDAQKVADSKTFGTTFEMQAGGGVFEALGTYSGPQVGNSYDGTAMGEERSMITYPGGSGKGKTPKV